MLGALSGHSGLSFVIRAALLPPPEGYNGWYSIRLHGQSSQVQAALECLKRLGVELRKPVTDVDW